MEVYCFEVRYATGGCILMTLPRIEQLEQFEAPHNPIRLKEWLKGFHYNREKARAEREGEI